MPLQEEAIVKRSLIIDRNHEICFFQLVTDVPHNESTLPFLLQLANIESPDAVYILPITWVVDGVVLNKLARNMILVSDNYAQDYDLIEKAKALGFRVATQLLPKNSNTEGFDFRLVTLESHAPASPDNIFVNLDHEEDFTNALNRLGMYFGGKFSLKPSATKTKVSIHPSHMLVLEIMSAVQQEADPREIEALFKRDVTLSFKLLRFINSPSFGLARRIDSVKHALSVIGYKQLLKWLGLLALSAGEGTSPAISHSAMVRARFMEQLAAKILDKQDQDNLFLIGLLSLIDIIMGVPITEILARANLAKSVNDTLSGEPSKYTRYLNMALACEGLVNLDETQYQDFDVRMINQAHLEAIEWATKITKSD